MRRWRSCSKASASLELAISLVRPLMRQTCRPGHARRCQGRERHCVQTSLTATLLLSVPMCVEARMSLFWREK